MRLISSTPTVEVTRAHHAPLKYKKRLSGGISNPLGSRLFLGIKIKKGKICAA
jgi:hypothetical protein